METIFFNYNGKQFSGTVISSHHKDDHYYWVIFDEPELLEVFGDSVAFHEVNGRIKSVYHYSRHSLFIEQLRSLLESHLAEYNLIKRRAV